MSIDFMIDKKEKYLKLDCHGTFSSEAVLNAYEKALNIAEREGLEAILVDISDLKGVTPTTMYRYDLGVAIARIQRNHANRTCIAVVGKEPIIEPQRFGETVAVNRGARGKVFTDIDEAVTWIESEIIK